MATTAYMLLVRLRTGSAACNCFGGVSGGSLAMIIARNAVLIVLSQVAGRTCGGGKLASARATPSRAQPGAPGH